MQEACGSERERFLTLGQAVARGRGEWREWLLWALHCPPSCRLSNLLTGGSEPPATSAHSLPSRRAWDSRP